ncbi:MAG: hypothetical protein EBQ98_04535 [Actinobacteria bacterium]|nr:hypothetical protein [Actinomycetota bacterium]
MATSTTTYLTNPTVTLTPATSGTLVDLTTLCSSATLTVGYDPLESTSFGDTGHIFVKGLQAVEVSLTLYAAYGASSVEATLTAALGTGTSTIVMSPAGPTEGPANPEYTITNTMLSSFTPINGSYGELSMIEVTFTGGTFARDITP